MSQKWVYTGINALTRQQQVLLLEDIKKYPWFGVHDNINIPFRAFQQRIENQNHFDSGTAATILVLKSPLARWPDRDLRMHQRALGADNLIPGDEIFMLAAGAGPRIDSHVISVVLQFLVESPDFDFETYAFKEDRIFSSFPIWPSTTDRKGVHSSSVCTQDRTYRGCVLRGECACSR